MSGKVVRYSEAFKLRVVRALESGEVEGIEEAKRKFGIPGATTVPAWLRRYGRAHLVPKVVRVEMADEKDRLKELRRENERLKRALADSHLEALLYREWLEAACREFGVQDVEGFKKKLEEESSK